MPQNAVEAGCQLRMNAPVDSMRPGLPLRFAQNNFTVCSGTDEDVVGGCGSEWTAMQRATCQRDL